MTDRPAQPQPEDETRASFAEDRVALPAGDGDLSQCPACHVGVLYVIAYDPDATHEAGNAESSQHPHFEPSGGSQTVRCFNCGITSSQALGEKEAD